MDTTLFKEYAQIDQEFKLLEEKKAAVRDKILAQLREGGVGSVETPVGNFTVGHRTTYTYSPAIEKIVNRLKIAKAKEEQKNIAKPSVSEYLIVTKSKTN